MTLLKDKTIIVTGGSRGLGRALCVCFARHGAHIAFSYHGDDQGAAATEQAVQALNRRCNKAKIAVTDSQAMETWIRQLEASQPVDALVNNAGVSQPVPVALMNEQDWDRVMNVNCKGAFIASRAVLPHMIKRRRGHILNMGSLAGTRMIEAPVHYCASKAALKAFTEGLCKEVARYRIQVNCLAPGLLEQGVADYLPEYKLRDYLAQVALARVGRLDEVAQLAAFMISDQNSYMNGATILMDGGL